MGSPYLLVPYLAHCNTFIMFSISLSVQKPSIDMTVGLVYMQLTGANCECNGHVWRMDVGMSGGVLNALPQVSIFRQSCQKSKHSFVSTPALSDHIEVFRTTGALPECISFEMLVLAKPASAACCHV